MGLREGICWVALRLVNVVSAVFLLIGAGWGGGSGHPYDVEGTVTFGGQPVPVGVILFEPDVSKGNSGPAGSARISQGRYATRPDVRATVGGPHVLRITGFDGIEASDEAPGGRPLFDEYTMAVDLVDRETQLDIDVPADAVCRTP